jgi:hypothetical protein
MIKAVLLLALCLSAALAFLPAQVKLGASMNGIVANRLETTELNQFKHADKTQFDSKLMPPFSEDELNAILKEFNVTNFDLDKDPELNKWSPSKEFFEKFGFQNNTERYKRKTMDVKIDFYSAYTSPILPQYKTFVSDVMTMVHFASIDSRYVYEPLHAFGICTQYYTIMKGYALQDEVRSVHLIITARCNPHLAPSAHAAV